ncbi:hypothetical protein ACHAPU_002354 [Fusarium lateritium]
MSAPRPATSQRVAISKSGAGRDDSTGAVKELEATLAGFQAILSDEDRKQLQKLKKTTHDAQSIITFTAELDAMGEKRRGRSIASRLASFLQTIEQFTPIIDTYIQSNPDISALIWGSIKLTFMFLANLTSYFQTFVELLHGFGSLCTRFAEYQIVFNYDSRLQRSICQFHSAVIICCQKIFMAIRQPVKSLIWKSLTQSFRAELRGFVEDIRTKAENVQGDIELTKAHYDREEQQLQTKEREETGDYRKRMFAWTSRFATGMDAAEAQRRKDTTERERHRLLQELCSYNYTSIFNMTRNKRHRGTAEWVFETREYQEWVESDQSCVLHITGKIGSGKSVLTSSIVERLAQVQPPQQFVSFFFLHFHDSISLDTETVIRSCVQQLLSAASAATHGQDAASNLDLILQLTKSSFFSRQHLTQLYITASSLVKDWFVVIDGLDESDAVQEQDILNFFAGVLQRLDKPLRIKLLLSSRETSSNAISHTFTGSKRLLTGLRNTSSDIRAYADDILTEKLSTGGLVVEDTALVDEILQTISSKEQGMFLWAFLAIEDICCGKSDKEIRRALEEIPADLPATFDRALGRIVKRRNQQIAKKAFLWTQAALQPLTLSQLREAFSIEIGQHTLRREDLISGIERLPIWNIFSCQVRGIFKTFTLN